MDAFVRDVTGVADVEACPHHKGKARSARHTPRPLAIPPFPCPAIVFCHGALHQPQVFATQAHEGHRASSRMKGANKAGMLVARRIHHCACIRRFVGGVETWVAELWSRLSVVGTFRETFLKNDNIYPTFIEASLVRLARADHNYGKASAALHLLSCVDHVQATWFNVERG